MKLIKTDRENFTKEIIHSSIPVVLIFYANWFGTWQISIPLIEKVYCKYTEKVKFCKIDVSTQQHIAGEYGIVKIPSIVFFSHGKAIDILLGLASQAEIERKIEALLD